MSSSSRTRRGASTSESPYPRENWYGDYEATRGSSDVDDQEKADPNEPAKIVAFNLLRQSGTALCATTLKDEPWNGGRMAELFAWCFDGECIDGHAEALHHANEEVELSDPAVRLGIQSKFEYRAGEFGAERFRKRVNEETGYLSGGETTAIIWQDRPVEDFMAVVDIYLSARPNVRDSEKEVARGLAHHLKTERRMRDLDIMERVVDELRSGDSK
jgi:hypothetical protein